MASPAPEHSPWLSANRATIPAGTRHAGRLAHWVIGACLAGECDHGQPGGRRFRFTAGQILIIRPGTPQQWRSVTDWDVISCSVQPRPHWLPWLAWEEVAPGFMRLDLAGDDWREARRRLLGAVTCSHSGHADAADFAGNELEAALLRCRRAWGDRSQGFDPRLRAAISALADDVAHAHTLDELASRCRLSRAHLARLFRAHVGVSPMAYLSRLRRQRASQLLRLSDLPIKRIALEIGHPDQRYFSTWFRRETGETPGDHRRRRS